MRLLFQHATLVLLLSLAGGCFLFHGTSAADSPDAGSPDPEDHDADTERPDLGSTLPDLGPPAPATPDEDLGEDARPSDHADDWDDSPEVPDCCELDPTIELGTSLGGIPVVEHVGDGWGVFVSGYQSAEGEGTFFFRLAEDGTPVAVPHQVGDEPGSLATHWAEGRFVTARQEGGDLWAGLFDRAGVPDGRWHEVFRSAGPGLGISGHAFGVGRLTHGDDYLAVYGASSRLAVAFLGVDGVAAEAAIDLASPVEALSVASLRSRFVVATADGDNAVDLHLGGARYVDHATRLTAGDGSPTWGVDVAALRDSAVVVYRQGDGLYSAVFDPFEARVTSDPRRIAPNGVSFRAESDLAGDDKRNLLGYCESIDGDSPSQVQLRVLDTGGRPVGEVIDISEGPEAGGRGCALGVDSEGFLVAWWGDDLTIRVRRARYR